MGTYILNLLMLFDLALQMKCIKSLKGIVFQLLALRGACTQHQLSDNGTYNGLRTLVQRRHALGIIDLFVKFPGT